MGFFRSTLGLKQITKCLKIMLLSLGIFSLLLLVLSFTSVPFWARYWLGTQYSTIEKSPEYIIMLGGSGMPSEDNLIRLYHTAYLGNNFKNSKIIVVHPKDSAVNVMMNYELTIRDIDTSRIIYECEGTNTRSQVLALLHHFRNLTSSRIVVVTAPEQVYRSVKSFLKAGYKNVSGYPAFNNDMQVDLTYKSKKIGGKRLVPDVGESLKFRYNFWNYLKIEITCLREFTAIVYYKLNGWI